MTTPNPLLSHVRQRPYLLRLRHFTLRELYDATDHWCAMAAAERTNNPDGSEHADARYEAECDELDRRASEGGRRRARKIKRLHALAHAAQERGR